MSITHLNVVIPYYKERAFLSDSINSVLNQTSGNWKLMIVDDSPEEDSFPKDLIEELADPRIKYHRKEKRSGISGAWNECLSLVDQGLLTILHADDCLKPEYIESVLNANADFPEARAFFTRSTTISENGDEIFSFVDFVKNIISGFIFSKKYVQLQGEMGLKKLLRGNFIMCPTMCYRISRDRKLKFAKLKQVLDYDMSTRILLEDEMLVGIPYSLFQYRRHRHNTSNYNLHDSTRFKEEQMVFERIRRRAAEKGWNSIVRKAKVKLPVFLYRIYSMIVVFFQQEKSGPRSEGHRKFAD